MSLKLSHYALHENPLAHAGKSERLCAEGWHGWTFTSYSPEEYRTLVSFKTKTCWVSGGHRDTETVLDRSFSVYSCSVWDRDPDHLAEVVAAIEALPERTAEFFIPELKPEMRALVRHENHILRRCLNDTAWVVSGPVCAPMAILRLMVP
jgi:hypothetical protein